MEPNYIVVSYDLFPGWVIHELDRIENGKYYITNTEFFYNESILGVVGHAAMKMLKSVVADQKEAIKEAKASALKVVEAALASTSRA